MKPPEVVLRVEPYFGNRTKRLIKAPKFVFLDTGLAAFLGGFRSVCELTESGLIGAFWESHVFGQILRQAASRGDANSVGYWRTAGGPEVDVVIERAGLGPEHRRCVEAVGVSMTLAWIVEHFEKVLV